MASNHKSARLQWTEKHVIEATAVLWRMAANLVCNKSFLAEGHDAAARDAIPRWAATEAGFIECATFYIGAPAASGLADRVRARAEGREEVADETFWRVRFQDGRPATIGGTSDVKFSRREEADDVATRALGARVVHVTLTRRRIARAPEVP